MICLLPHTDERFRGEHFHLRGVAFAVEDKSNSLLTCTMIHQLHLGEAQYPPEGEPDRASELNHVQCRFPRRYDGFLLLLLLLLVFLSSDVSLVILIPKKLPNAVTPILIVVLFSASGLSA